MNKREYMTYMGIHTSANNDALDDDVDIEFINTIENLIKLFESEELKHEEVQRKTI